MHPPRILYVDDDEDSREMLRMLRTDQLRQIFEPSAEKLCQAGLHTKVLIRRGNPADQILEEANTWGANCIFVGAKGREALIVCYLVVFPPRFQRVPLLS